MDGQIVEGSEARVSVTDHGLLYGDGIFEGIRVYGRKLFRLADHLRRFGAAARAIGLELPGGMPTAEKAVIEAARAHGEDEAYLRLVATRGPGALGVDPTECHTPTLFCIADGIRLYEPAQLARGVDLVTVSVRRPALDALDPRVKSLNYLNSVLAKREARLRGADEALILNAAGTIAEASVANLFIARRGELLTPPANDGALEGITRASVLELSARLELPVREVTLGRFDVFDADECFLTGTGAGIVPVSTLDGQPIGEGRPTGLTARVREAFSAFTKERGTAF